MDDQLDQIASLNRYSLVLAAVQTFEDLETICRIINTKLKCRDLSQFNILVLEAICNPVLTKIFVIGMGPEGAKLADAMIVRNIMPVIYVEVFQSMLSTQLDGLYNIERKEEPKVIKYDRKAKKEFRDNLSELLKTDANPELAMPKTMGYSFFSASGEYIWGDRNTLRLLEIKQDQAKELNLFQQMIPYSAHYLSTRFGEKLFKRNAKIGSTICFSFVIYSKQSVAKYIKQLRNKKIKRLSEVQEEESTKGVYFKYLKALSCRVTLVPLQYSKEELEKFLQKRKKAETSEVTVEVTAVAKKKISKKNRRTKSTNKNQTREVSDKPVEVSVMLEMRTSKNIPEFNYRAMEDDPKILEFKNYIKKRLNDTD